MLGLEVKKITKLSKNYWYVIFKFVYHIKMKLRKNYNNNNKI